MGARSGSCLCGLQFFLRIVQFSCAAVTLALFAYFLATLYGHNLPIGLWVRVVAGVGGSGVVYTIFALLLLCCAPGQSFLSFLLSFLDLVFAAGFGYVAAVNRGGAGSCNGWVRTAFGEGDARDERTIDAGGSPDGITVLPNLKQACMMEKTTLAVGIVAAILFAFSVVLNICLSRNRKKAQHLGPSPENDYTSGYGRRSGFFGRRQNQPLPPPHLDPNGLPLHATPDDVVRHSFATTEHTRVPSSGTGVTITTGGGGYGNLGIPGKYEGGTTPGVMHDIPLGRSRSPNPFASAPPRPYTPRGSSRAYRY